MTVDEAIINLQVNLKLKNILESAGSSNVKRADLKERVNIINQENVTLFISIHCNTSFDRSCKGAEAYYRINDHHSQNLASSILNQLK